MAKTSKFVPGRRDLFKYAAVAAVSFAAGRLSYLQAQQNPAASTSPFFPGFRTFNVTGKGMPGRHNMQEGAPARVLADLQSFLKG